MNRSLAVLAMLCWMAASTLAGEAALEVRILGSSSQGGVLVRTERSGTLRQGDVVRVERDGQALGEAAVASVRPDGTLVVAARFKGDIRSTDRLYFVRHGEPIPVATGGGLAINVPIDPTELALANRGTARLQKEVGPISRDAALTARLQRIGRRVVDACPRSGLTWTFEVLESKVVNALTVGLGRIYVTRALMEMLDDEELAGAVSHEVAHVCLRHSTRATDAISEGRAYLKKADECLAEAQVIAKDETGDPEMRKIRLRAKLKEAQEWRDRAAAIADRLQNWKTGDGWEQEYEADRMGLVYAQGAGYRPQGLVDALQKLAARDRSEFFATSTIEGASTHPPMTKRIEIARTVTSSLRRR